MKYIDADKIRTEIKRLKAENNCGTDEFIAAKDIAYDKVFDFLEILEEPVTDCHDLEEAAENSWAVYEYRESPKGLYSTCYIDGFKAGAEWMKRNMMEGSVAVEVVGEKRDLRLIDSTQRCLFNAKRGDWLKIIIVKEEEQ